MFIVYTVPVTAFSEVFFSPNVLTDTPLFYVQLSKEYSKLNKMLNIHIVKKTTQNA